MGSRAPAIPSPGTNLPRVAILGRPNVGKSSLFNRLVERRQALVHNLPGVTRDRLYGRVDFAGHAFEAIDTGGLEPEARETLKALIARQVELAIREAAVLVLVVDGQAGVTALDRHIARLVRRQGKPILVAVNKVDSQTSEPVVADFYELGLGEPVPVSAVHGRNIDALLDRILAVLGEPVPGGAITARGVRLAFVGKPNAGKSTLVNTLLGEARLLVDVEPGTTRDAVFVPFVRGGREWVLVDTAGLRRPARVSSPLERLAVASARRALEGAQISIIVLDATRPLDAQDKRVAGLVQESARPCVIALNKCDTLPQGARVREEWDGIIRKGIHFLRFCPLVMISGRDGRNLDGLMRAIEDVDGARRRRLEQAMLRAMFKEAQLVQAPPSRGTRRLRIMDVCQAPGNAGTFVLRVNDPDLATGSYLRYLNNTLRSALGLPGVPISFVLRRGRLEVQAVAPWSEREGLVAP